MNDARHTPGPWRVYTPAHPLDGFLCAVVANPGVLAWVLAPLDDAATGAANAHLIAAAPDLLAALRGLVEAHDQDPPMLTAAEWEAARAALARAHG